MGTRITDISSRYWEVFVNGNPVVPRYGSESAGMARAEKEARKHHIVTLTLRVGDRRPRIVGTWTDGKRD